MVLGRGYKFYFVSSTFPLIRILSFFSLFLVFFFSYMDFLMTGLFMCCCTDFDFFFQISHSNCVVVGFSLF